MYCSKCGAALSPTVRFCPDCGNAASNQKASVIPQPEMLNTATADTNTKYWTKRRIIWVIVVVIIVTAISSIVRNLSPTKPSNGQVALDVNLVETTIHDGILEQNGEDVTVDCPSEMIGKPGDTRNCVVTDSTGTNYFVVVTFESSKGDITWILQ